MKSTTTVSVGIEPADQPDVTTLIALSDAVAAALYPGAVRQALDAKALDSPDIVLLVARDHKGAAAGCCALFLGPNATGELKRMIVHPSHRGRGVGAALVEAVCEAARSRGVTCVQLEVGIRNIEAKALYARAGFRDRGPFGHHVPTAISAFMERDLSNT